jgi:nucleotide-binding universal stress UspA family protein
LLICEGIIRTGSQEAMRKEHKITTLHRIVVGQSFFSDGNQAVQVAKVLAERASAALYLLHVVEPSSFERSIRFPSVPVEAMLKQTALNARAQLLELAQRPEFSRIHVEIDVRRGKPFVELIRACREWNGDLIVVGASPRGEGHLLGSTGERVLRKSPVPVLVAKRALPVGPLTVLIPTDFSSCSAQAAKEALALVRGCGGQAVFLHVLDLHSIYPDAYGAYPVALPPLTPAEIEPDWQEFLHRLPLEGIAWEKQTREGRAASTITDAAVKLAADLIVIGTHGRTGVAHMLLGSVAEAVLRLTSCSVLTVRPDAFRFELP